MIERIFAPALTFAVLIAGHVVIVASLISGPAAPSGELTAKAAATARQAG